MATFSEHLLDEGLIGFGRSRGEGESNLAKTKFEQTIAAARLAVIVALRCGPSQDLDLPVVQSKAPIDRPDVCLSAPVVRERDPRRTALDDSRRDGRAINIRERLGGENDRSILLAQRL